MISVCYKFSLDLNDLPFCARRTRPYACSLQKVEIDAHVVIAMDLFHT
jgi:hypothetical protein